MLGSFARVFRRAMIATVALAGLLAAQPATAGYDVCNQTRFPVDAAIAYFDQGRWISVGWYHVQPDACRQLLTGALNNQYYYLFAERAGGGYIWEGDYYFCAADDAFEIVGDSDCRRRGYYALGFFEVDVRNSKHWTTDLVE